MQLREFALTSDSLSMNREINVLGTFRTSEMRSECRSGSSISNNHTLDLELKQKTI